MSAMTCPCCDQPITAAVRDPLRVLAMIQFSQLERRIAEYLARNLGRWVPAGALVDAVYSDDPDGGPITAHVAIAVKIMTIRKRLMGTPLALEGYAGGRGHGGRRMVWRSAA